jgi:hypothetical protein
VRTIASVTALLLLSAALLTGCNISCLTDDQEITAQTTSVQLKEDVRLANERARLAEERAELEKQKRQLAEERLKQPGEADTNDNAEEPIEDKETGGS